LCIPYWKAPRFAGDSVDIGAVRPLPSDVIAWDCESIHASAYTPGKRLDVSVDVRNSGPGNATAIATVIIYWADPTVGFSKPTFFGAASVKAAPARNSFQASFATTPTISGVIPATAPEHICLLAVVTHSLDRAPTVADPVNKRHWAQRNVVTVTTQPGLPLILPFVVANPFAAEESFELVIQALDGRALEHVALRQRLEPGEGRVHIQLTDDRGTTIGEGGRGVRMPLSLGPHKKRRMSMTVRTDGLDRNQVAAVEAVLYPRRDGENAVGSLGLIIKAGRSD
jgi:hypothetical protein